MCGLLLTIVSIILFHCGFIIVNLSHNKIHYYYHKKLQSTVLIIHGHPVWQGTLYSEVCESVSSSFNMARCCL